MQFSHLHDTLYRDESPLSRPKHCLWKSRLIEMRLIENYVIIIIKLHTDILSVHRFRFFLHQYINGCIIVHLFFFQMNTSSKAFWPLVAAASLGVGFVGYCVYFDRKRRSAPEFREKLKASEYDLLILLTSKSYLLFRTKETKTTYYWFKRKYCRTFFPFILYRDYRIISIRLIQVIPKKCVVIFSNKFNKVKIVYLVVSYFLFDLFNLIPMKYS